MMIIIMMIIIKMIIITVFFIAFLPDFIVLLPLDTLLGKKNIYGIKKAPLYEIKEALINTLLALQ